MSKFLTPMQFGIWICAAIVTAAAHNWPAVLANIGAALMTARVWAFESGGEA